MLYVISVDCDHCFDSVVIVVCSNIQHVYIRLGHASDFSMHIRCASDTHVMRMKRNWQFLPFFGLDFQFPRPRWPIYNRGLI